MASRLERVVAGLWVVGISTGCYEVYESYKDDEFWIKEALNVAVDLGEVRPRTFSDGLNRISTQII